MVGTYSRRSANQVVAGSDLVIFVGTRAGGMTTHFWTMPPKGTAAIQIDIDPSINGRNYPNDVSIVGDAKICLEKMSEINVPVPRSRAQWLTEVKNICSSYKGDYSGVYRSRAVPIRPERIVHELSEAMPRECNCGCRYWTLGNVDGRNVRDAVEKSNLHSKFGSS